MKQNLFLDVGVNQIDHKYIITKNKTTHFQTTHFLVNQENKKQIKRKLGDYFVIEFRYEKIYLTEKFIEKEVERVLKSFLKKYNKAQKVLVVGLGNPEVMGDTLGIEVTNKVIATNQYHDFLTIPKIALFNPSVTEKTGINSYKLIEMVVKDIKPDIMVIVDSLATKEEKYLNNAIEINNTGIIPGSALNAAREINEKSFRIPILSIGVPCCFTYHKNVYTSPNIKEIIDRTSTIIATAINHIFIEHQ